MSFLPKRRLEDPYNMQGIDIEEAFEEWWNKKETQTRIYQSQMTDKQIAYTAAIWAINKKSKYNLKSCKEHQGIPQRGCMKCAEAAMYII